MPVLNDIHSLIVPATQANFTAHSYTEIYAGKDETVIINGVPVNLVGCSSIRLKVFSISAATGSSCYLLGENMNNKYDNPTLF